MLPFLDVLYGFKVNFKCDCVLYKGQVVGLWGVPIYVCTRVFVDKNHKMFDCQKQKLTAKFSCNRWEIEQKGAPIKSRKGA